jgi:hypothetical protein
MNLRNADCVPAESVRMGGGRHIALLVRGTQNGRGRTYEYRSEYGMSDIHLLIEVRPTCEVPVRRSTGIAVEVGNYLQT